VVHYDLPWTAARRAQREGRTRRGTPTDRTVVTVAPPGAVEARLRLGALLARKEALPGRIDLAAGADALWRWRQSLASWLDGPEALGAWAAMHGPRAGVLVGFAICIEGGVEIPSVLWLGDDVASDAPTAVHPVLRAALSAAPAALRRGEHREALARAAPALAARLRASQRAAWQAPVRREGVGQLQARLWDRARAAARARRGAELATLQRALRFIGGGHTAGEAALVASLAAAPVEVLARALATLPAPSPAGVPVLRLHGMLVVKPALASGSGPATFGAHDALPDGAVRPRRDADRLDPAHPRQLPTHDGRARHPAAE
jgi:hypothetical protein